MREREESVREAFSLDNDWLKPPYINPEPKYGQGTMNPAIPDKPIKGSRQLRLGRRSIPGEFYIITTSTFNREPIFLNAQAASIVLESLRHIESQGRMSMEAAVVMPDHVHLVAGLASGTLGELMHGFKGFSAKAINRLLNRQGPVWNSQYHDHAIRKDEVLMDVIGYCLANPVRARLVGDFHDYPHWYCRYKV